MKPLTTRELACLHWVALGKTSWETGVILGITERTVNFHIQNACRKLQVQSRQAAVTALMHAGQLSSVSEHLPPPLPGTHPLHETETRRPAPSQ